MFRTTERLIPNVVRQLSAQKRPYATIVSGDGEYQHLTFRDLDNASSKAAWFIDQNLQGQDKFLYMGPNDIRYLIWVLAAMKTRKCVVFPSPGNTVSANIGLFDKVGATTLFHAPEVLDTLSALLAATRATITPIATLDYREFLSDTVVEAYPFEGTFDELRETPFMGLHTSGTSGHPKPIYWNHLAATTMLSFLDPDIEALNDGLGSMKELMFGTTVAVLFPLFHFGGIAPLLTSIHCENTVVLLWPGTRPAPANVTTLLRVANCDAAFLPPAILEPTAGHPPALEALSKLKVVGYSGGAVNPTRGAELANHIRKFFPILASTEGGPVHAVSPKDSSHWNAFKFVDVGQRMEEVAPGFYELVFPRTSLVNFFNAYFHTFSHLETEYRTSDLFSPVEGQDGLWVYRGRADNWMTLSTGLKMDPTDVENLISSHPDVRGAIIAGAYRFQPCLLVELKQPPADQEAQAQALEALWPTVAKANERAPKAGRIPRELILFATESKPFLRASKGTIQRVLTIREYAEEIDQVYALAEEGLLTGGLPALESTKPEDIIVLLRAIFSDALHNTDAYINSTDDLFLHGLDSLGTSIALARLRAALRKYGVDDEKLKLIKSQLIYKEPTLEGIAGAISNILSSAGTSEDRGVEVGRKALDQTLQTYEQKLRSNVEGRPESPTRPTQDGHTVVLTGSTGSVGSYILASLIARKDVKKIFCLNRGQDASTKQVASFRARGLAGLDADDGRVVYLRATMHEPNLGLPDDEYATLIHEATTIVHNAFPVNFLLSLPAFEPQFQALLNLLKLATDGDKSPAVLFVSSISAGLPITARNYVVPQAVLSRDDAKHILHQGYAEAKYVCERLLETFASISKNKKVAVLRVGQVCGPTEGNGTWNVSEWTPSLVISSKFLGASPKSIGNLTVNWVPVDKLGNIVSELVSATSTEAGDAFTVYNIINPTVTPWEELRPALEKVAPEVVEASEWLVRLENSDKGHHLINENPGLKLVDFYKETMLGSEVEITTKMDNILRVSETMRSLPRVKIEHLQRWMHGWGL
ncbi:hypothetical protein F5X98DRAFT_314939 [Xylaria grammica]|nr:hypothetical protein F5X98DRAFT_314939 [Xylaria grammica]